MGTQILGYAVGGLQLVLALAVARRLGALGRTLPWLGGLTVFFVLRGLTRIVETAERGRVEVLAVPVDVLLICALVLLIVGIDRTIRGLLLEQDAARYREQEYRRALADYRRLTRHRLANPLTAIRGGISALKTLDLDDASRRHVLEMLERESARLERLSLSPNGLRPEERNLAPAPRAMREPGS